MWQENGSSRLVSNPQSTLAAYRVHRAARPQQARELPGVGCHKPPARRGLCRAHYVGSKRSGEPLPPKLEPRPRTQVERAHPKLDFDTRFWARVRKTDSPWWWTGRIDRGRRAMDSDGKKIYAHIYVYTQLKGRASEAMLLHNTCGHRDCVLHWLPR
jgi:hypothetical protein